MTEKTGSPLTRLDRLIGVFSPSAAVRRAGAREVLAYYEAAEPTRHRNFYKRRGSANEIVQRDAVALRTQARHLIANYDIARGANRTIVNNVIGAAGIGVEPRPRTSTGELAEDYAAALSAAYKDWCKRPEVTHRYTFAQLQRAVGWSYFRDGEVFGQFVAGLRADLDHGTRVPLSLEVFECDLVPMDLSDTARRVIQGIERNAWGRPTALHVHKSDPWRIARPTLGSTKVIPWERVLHLAALDHIGQVRGVTPYASVITRLEDIKDYEESERVAAKIAAMLTAYVKKGTPEDYNASENSEDGPRELGFSPGTIIDDLGKGEEIGIIDSKRPSANVMVFRQGQIRAFAAGVGGSASSFSKAYEGSYSSQRQELVEQWINYAVMSDDFVGRFIEPTYSQFVEAAHLSGVVPRPINVPAETAGDALYVAQAMPWIDPVKEAMAWQTLVDGRFASEIEVIRRRGQIPADVLDNLEQWQKMLAARGLDAQPIPATASGGSGPVALLQALQTLQTLDSGEGKA